MKKRPTKRIGSISEFHRLRGLPGPEHPLISVVDYSAMVRPDDIGEVNWMLDFYQVSLKRGLNAKLKYGQQQYDFDEGVMFFIAPKQVFRIEPEPQSGEKKSGWMLLVHPDFMRSSALSKSIRKYDFFGYGVNEALFLSEKEEVTLNGIIDNIRRECQANIDKFSQHIIVAHIETLLRYCERFYERQFITRKAAGHKVLDRLEEVLNAYYEQEGAHAGLPTVQFVAGELNLSPNYLSRLLQTLVGQSTQQFIQDKIVEKAKEKLAVTDLSISEIAYALGFEHPQSLTRLFKSKTSLSPQDFRQSLN